MFLELVKEVSMFSTFRSIQKRLRMEARWSDEKSRVDKGFRVLLNENSGPTMLGRYIETCPDPPYSP